MNFLRPALVLLAVSAFGLSSSSAADVAPGQPAPDFTLPDLDGNSVALSSFRGKTVVLEWFNPGCPFVKHGHAEGPLKDQAARHKDDVVWIAVNSGAPGKQGHGVEANRKAAAEWTMDHAVLLDESGAVGRAYGASTTPHMFVIDAEGTIRYEGAVDNAPLGRVKGAAASNHVDAALADLAAGRAVAQDYVKPYGCSVKYGK